MTMTPSCRPAARPEIAPGFRGPGLGIVGRPEGFGRSEPYPIGGSRAKSTRRGRDRVERPDIPWSTGGAAGTMTAMPELEIDVATLPEQASPPAHWQERSACYPPDPEIFLPTPR